MTIDFNGFANGEDLEGEVISYGVGTVTITSSGPNAGAAAFDSSSPGPNDFGGAPDPDLLIGIPGDPLRDFGNLLILQNNGSFGGQSSTIQTVPDIYDVPNDDAGGGTLFFDFTTPVFMESVLLADINGGGNTTITLTSALGTRVYSVPDDWTGDIDQGEVGFQTLDLTTLAAQVGVGPGTPSATASEAGTFDPSGVTSVTVFFNGSAGLDNLTFIPEPSTGVLFAIGLMGLAAGRRRN